MEVPVRDMLIQMLEWYIGTKTDFKVSVWKYGKLLERYLAEEEWQKVVCTYPDGDFANMWVSLFTMCELFQEISESVAKYFNYQVPDEKKVFSYLKDVEQLHRIKMDSRGANN